MSTTLANINTLVLDRLRDTSQGSVTTTGGVFRAINNALDLMQQIHDWEFTIEKSTINYHSGIREYAAPSDYKAYIDLQKQKPPRNSQSVLVYANNFDTTTLKPERIAIDLVGRSRLIYIKHTGGLELGINTATSVSDNGTWTASGDASNVTTDSNESFDLGASVNFDITAGTSGVLTNTGFTQVDLSTLVDRSLVYMNVYLPTITNITSITLKFGSSASDYYTQTVTTNHVGGAFAVGWNKCSFNWSSTVGTPDTSAIDYLQTTFTYGGATTDTDFRIENIFASEDVPMDFIYYSQNMVTAAADGAETPNFTDATKTTDTPFWSGDYDGVTNTFVDVVLEDLFFQTGEKSDLRDVRQIQEEKLKSLRSDIPSRRKFPTSQMNIRY